MPVAYFQLGPTAAFANFIEPGDMVPYRVNAALGICTVTVLHPRAKMESLALDRYGTAHRYLAVP